MTDAELKAIRERYDPKDTRTKAFNPFVDIAALLGEVERLREALEELVDAHDAPPWGDGEDPHYEKAVALGRRLDAAWARAREALGRGGEG